MWATFESYLPKTWTVPTEVIDSAHIFKSKCNILGEQAYKAHNLQLLIVDESNEKDSERDQSSFFE